MGFDPIGRKRMGYSDLEEDDDDPELAIQNQMPIFGQQSLIIEMEPVDTVGAGPSTSAQHFQPIQLQKGALKVST